MIACDCELVLKDRHQANICAWGLASVVSRGLQGPPKTTHHNPLVQDGGSIDECPCCEVVLRKQQACAENREPHLKR